MAWVPKGSTQVKNKDGDQEKGTIGMKERKRARRQLSHQFAPNHQRYWFSNHSNSLLISPMSMSWNSSPSIFGYPSYSYFDPSMPHGSLNRGGFLPNYCAYY
ncbi:hypothetical protein BAE44_0021398 [Dichanthelium oligosanthes]|uniref:Uncharacterized protein n=1 Tax=Dichanthelium oligosanthes TaxID=888268 RepID=A0A1E5UXG5_9POAL|nr:hypothetical protein BAE44_0021398 [Dichanthelium oligosanthes]